MFLEVGSNIPMIAARQASKGLPRMAVPKGLNHLPDDLLQQAIDELR